MWRQGVFMAAVVVAGCGPAPGADPPAGVRRRGARARPHDPLEGDADAPAAAARRVLSRLAVLVAGRPRGPRELLVGGHARRVRRRSARSPRSRPARSRRSSGTSPALAVITVGIPLLATAVLVGLALRRGEDDPHAASFLATTGAYVPLLVVQVAAFAAGHVEHVSERYLVTAAPPLFLGLGALGRARAPRPASCSRRSARSRWRRWRSPRPTASRGRRASRTRSPRQRSSSSGRRLARLGARRARAGRRSQPWRIVALDAAPPGPGRRRARRSGCSSSRPSSRRARSSASRPRSSTRRSATTPAHGSTTPTPRT